MESCVKKHLGDVARVWVRNVNDNAVHALLEDEVRGNAALRGAGAASEVIHEAEQLVLLAGHLRELGLVLGRDHDVGLVAHDAITEDILSPEVGHNASGGDRVGLGVVSKLVVVVASSDLSNSLAENSREHSALAVGVDESKCHNSLLNGGRGITRLEVVLGDKGGGGGGLYLVACREGAGSLSSPRGLSRHGHLAGHKAAGGGAESSNERHGILYLLSDLTKVKLKLTCIRKSLINIHRKGKSPCIPHIRYKRNN